MAADEPLAPLTDAEVLWLAGLLRSGNWAEREREDAA